VQPDSSQKVVDAIDAVDHLFTLHRTLAADADNTKKDDDDDDYNTDATSQLPESLGTFLWNLWPVFHNIAQQLQAPPLPLLPSDTPTFALDEWGNDEVRLWQGLPLFGPMMYEI
jgi:hypothetical protein